MRAITIGLLAVALLLGYAGSANAADGVANTNSGTVIPQLP